MAGIKTKSGLLFWGEALASAMNSLAASMEVAKTIAATAQGGIVIAQKILTDSSKAIQDLLKSYEDSKGEYLLAAEGVKTDDLKPIFDELIKTLAVIADPKILPDSAEYKKAEEDLKMEMAKLLTIFSMSPVYNPDEWDAYEIEPPKNPVFKPKKVNKIPDNMELYEVACPATFRGASPVQPSCGINPCQTACKLTNQNCQMNSGCSSPSKPKRVCKKGKKCKRKATIKTCKTCPGGVRSPYSPSPYAAYSYYPKMRAYY